MANTFQHFQMQTLKYGTTTSSYEYHMNDGGSCCSRLDVPTSEKDLGVWITSKLDFTLHCDNTSSKAMQPLGLIKKNFHPSD